MHERLTDATRWTIAENDLEVTTGVVHTADGPRVYLALENTAELSTGSGGGAVYQVEGWLTPEDVDVVIARLLAAREALAAVAELNQL